MTEEEQEQEPLKKPSELEKYLEEEEEGLYTDEDSDIEEELKDNEMFPNAEVSEDKVKKEYVNTLNEIGGSYRVVVPKELVRKYNLRPKDKIVFLEGDDMRENVIHMKIFLPNNPDKFRMPFEKWEEHYYD